MTSRFRALYAFGQAQLIPALILAIMLFTAGAMVGYVQHEAISGFAAQQLSQLGDMVEQMQQSEQPGLFLFGFIFLGNTLTVALVMVFGVVFGIYPVFVLLFNGLLLGYVMQTAAQSVDVSSWELFLYGILPHGILELPVVFLAAAYGMRLGQTVWRYLMVRVSSQRDLLRERVEQFHQVRRQFPMLLITCVVLLLCAALIEAYVTPLILYPVLGK